MNLVSEQDRALVRAAGFDVCPDVDQPGMWVWVARDEQGKQLEGCPASFGSEDEAYQDAYGQVVEDAMGEADISDEAWDAAAHDQRLRLVRSAFGR